MMTKLVQFAEMILENNSVDTMIDVVCNLSDEEIKMIMA